MALVTVLTGGLAAATTVTSGLLPVASQLREWSGVVACRSQPGTWWAMNDGGNAPELLHLNASLAVTTAWTVAAPNVDWEDLAWADGRLFIADTGDNRRHRDAVQIHVMAEPAANAPATAPLPVERTYRLTFPTGPRDVEALVICERWLWLIDKRLSGAEVWRAARSGPDAQVLESIPVPGLPAIVLAGDLHPHGDLLALAHPLGVTLLALTAGDLTTIDPLRTRNVMMPLAPQREAVAFSADGREVLAGSESGHWWRFPPADVPPAVSAAP